MIPKWLIENIKEQARKYVQVLLITILFILSVIIYVDNIKLKLENNRLKELETSQQKETP